MPGACPLYTWNFSPHIHLSYFCSLIVVIKSPFTLTLPMIEWHPGYIVKIMDKLKLRIILVWSPEDGYFIMSWWPRTLSPPANTASRLLRNQCMRSNFFRCKQAKRLHSPLLCSRYELFDQGFLALASRFMAHEATWVYVRIPADCVYITENIRGRRRVSQTCTMKSSAAKKVLVKVDAYSRVSVRIYRLCYAKFISKR